MLGKFRNSVVGGVTGAAIFAVLGWVVFKFHNNYVIEFIMPPMVEENEFGNPPLLTKLDERYVKQTTESTDNAGDDIKKKLSNLKRDFDNLKRDVDKLQVESATSAADPPQKIARVRLYLSTVRGEEDSVVLNGDSSKLARDIRYGARYGVTLADDQFSEDTAGFLNAEFQHLDAPGQGRYAAIGRIPERHFKRLNGSLLGYVDADLHLRVTEKTRQ